MSGGEPPKILGLTIHSPWAELVARGLKTVENRSWAPPPWLLGRYLAVHASTRWDQEGAEFVERNASRFRAPDLRPEACQKGVVAVARVVGWVQRVELGQPGPKVISMLPGCSFTEQDWRWFVGAEFGWLLRDVQRITPVACRGQQKLWRLPSPVYDSVRRRYDAARRAG